MTTKSPQEHEELLAVDGRNYTCLFRRDAGGGYMVTCEEMPPAIAYGETLEEARAEASAEIAAWTDTCRYRDWFPASLPR